MGIFEKASRMKLRFISERGPLNVEDLWDINLEIIDRMAMALKKGLDEDKKGSFLNKVSSNDEKETSFEICKYIIETRLKEAEEKDAEASEYQRKQKILSIISRKKEGELEEKSIEELEAMV